MDWKAKCKELVVDINNGWEIDFMCYNCGNKMEYFDTNTIIEDGFIQELYGCNSCPECCLAIVKRKKE